MKKCSLLVMLALASLAIYAGEQGKRHHSAV